MNRQRGFSLLELLIGLAVVSLAATALTSLVIQNSQVNRRQQMYAMIQANARNSMELIVGKLRSAGWDPMNAGIAVLATDPDPTDEVSEIEVFADLDEDGATAGSGEQVLIRHVGDRIEWRLDPDSPFTVVARDISNDADGDGSSEPMFQLDDPLSPSGVTIQITARSPVADPRTRDFLRYTLTNRVALRKRP